ncbi:MAG TPA: SPOR domain-containing protein [Novosphingobium sp.]
MALAAPAFAQRPPVIAQPVVQQVPGVEGQALNTALARLGRDPRDVGALLDAGNAALTMGDVEAATGFFRRADQVSPGNPRVKAGLAGAMVRNGDPFGALPLFEEAEKAGALDGALIGDHGLAYDLVGDNVTAQRYYRRALANATNDEIVRRLSLSQAISGNRSGAEITLAPLLQRRDQAAWRTRAFALAILGKTEEAVSISNSLLPRDIAEGIAPYLRYMPRLTKAQQAAAANFGAFPRASEIGRDDPRVAAYVGRSTSLASADTALVPRGEPLGRSSRSRDRKGDRMAVETVDANTRVVRMAPPDPMPTKEAGPPTTPAVTLSASGLASGASSTPVQPAAVTVAAPVPPPPSAPPVSAAAAPPATSLPPASIPAPAPATPPSPPPGESAPPVRPRSLAEAFGDLGAPSTDALPAPGAVDIRGMGSARPKPVKAAAPAKPPPPSHPSRIWVQIATGRDKPALAFDWRRMARQSAEVFRGKQPHVSAWGQNTRLLAGPFASEAAANAYVSQLRRANIDGPFVWTSPAGQVVDELKP